MGVVSLNVAIEDLLGCLKHCKPGGIHMGNMFDYFNIWNVPCVLILTEMQMIIQLPRTKDEYSKVGKQVWKTCSLTVCDP